MLNWTLTSLSDGTLVLVPLDEYPFLVVLLANTMSRPDREVPRAMLMALVGSPNNVLKYERVLSLQNCEHVSSKELLI